MFKEAETRRRKWLVLVSVLSVVVIVVLFGLSFFEPFLVFKNAKILELDKGCTTRDIAFILKDKGVIWEPYSFIFWSKVLNYDSKLKSGIYDLKPVSNMSELLLALSKGGRPKELTITIPEGFTSMDIAERLYNNGIVRDKDLFLKYIKPYEGYLFPDTYNFYEDMQYETILKKFLDRFNEVVPQNYGELAKKKGLTKKQAIILASLVEKEAKFNEDRPIVASVFLNRLAIGMPLQADSTILYALGIHKEWLTKEDYQIDSPYNTYKYVGLPPTPICNPGLKSIIAVVEAPKTDYYYFMTTPEGKAIFSKTLAEHEANLRKYYGGV
ncbi:MAG: endolytic transglycosylase MltG [Caldisericum exile]|uniref:endolytic transglycosylase MltG n=1 Tax=Caldisericum exile TaxID=693075 RepID=UPI003C781247